MEYNQALQEWGRRKLQKRHPNLVINNISGVSVSLEVDPGNDCCGGEDPHCYCSLAEPASVYVLISYRTPGKWNEVEIPGYMFDMQTMVMELFEIANEENKND